MRYLSRIALLAVVAVLPAVPASFAQNPPVGMGKTLFVEGIDAVVNDEVILAGEVEEVMETIAYQYGYDFSDRALYERERRKVLDGMIDDLLLYQYGIEKGYSLRKDQLQERVEERIREMEENESIKRQGGLEAVLKRSGRSLESLRRSLERRIQRQYVRDMAIRMNIMEKVQISERELDKIRRENPDFIRKQQTVEVRQIFFRCPKNAPQEKVEEVRKRAEQVYLQIKAGEDFEEMARQYSEHVLTQREGGLMPPYSRGELAEPFDRAFDMEVGEVCEPFRTPAGFHILKLESKPTIEQIVESQRRNEKLNEWLKELRAEALAKGTLIIKGAEPGGESSPPTAERVGDAK
jgi:peptidyl-prolyl cis-trans isomerase SurA